MTYTYDEAARAARMILRGILILSACILHGAGTALWSLVVMLVRHPLQALGVAAGVAAVAGFVPMVVALCYMIA